jgi:hypothetical protein
MDGSNGKVTAMAKQACVTYAQQLQLNIADGGSTARAKPTAGVRLVCDLHASR